MNDIIFLWVHPRSRSSAMERVMLERGDLRVFHEPFLYLYYVHDAKRPLAHFDVDSSRPVSYEAIRDEILWAARQAPVFVKDMCYYVTGHMFDDVAFMKQVKHSYLIRDPRRAIASYYRLDREFGLEEVGLEAQWHHFERVAELTGQRPPVVEADEFAANPHEVMAAYCDSLDLPHLSGALAWEPGLPEAWGDVAGWHSGVAQSRGIERPAEASAAPVLPPKFEDFYEHHLPYYQALYERRLDWANTR